MTRRAEQQRKYQPPHDAKPSIEIQGLLSTASWDFTLIPSHLNKSDQNYIQYLNERGSVKTNDRLNFCKVYYKLNIYEKTGASCHMGLS